jgi:endonuclease/exonuclease/phosphatase family metal-dependent hydrolase
MELNVKDVLEACCIKLETMVVLNVYRPPNGNVETFIKTLQNILIKLKCQNKNKSILLMGDINIDLKKISTHHLTRMYAELLEELGFLSYNTLPTRHCNRSISLIDHIFLYNHNQNVLSNGVMLTAISDHE